VSLRDSWDAQADAWLRFARTPGHDRAHELVNFPPFLELLPTPGKKTLDLGCGEGRVGAELASRGHDVIGVDSSPQMVAHARERHEAVVADATALPFEDEAFDLVVAYMSLMNMEDIPAAVHECARVLEHGGRMCIAVLHPITAAGEWADDRPESAFVIERYYDKPTKVWVSDRDGIAMTFHDRCITLEEYSRAFEAGGLVVESVREIPHPWRGRIPLFLHVQVLKP